MLTLAGADVAEVPVDRWVPPVDLGTLYRLTKCRTHRMHRRGVHQRARRGQGAHSRRGAPPCGASWSTRVIDTVRDRLRFVVVLERRRAYAEHRSAPAVESTSNIAHAAHPGVPSSCRNAPSWRQRGRRGMRLTIDVERIVDSIRATFESTRPANQTSRAGAESNNRRSQVVPPAGFEPALPPPEAGRSRDRERLRASYLGFLFASCVSDGLLCFVVRSTRHSTTSVLIGRI